ncbi:hypothetical protein CAC02_01015 [Streptococcus gallolyticus]|uniref:Uncharacterized protein n=1 Tax=Streptococcus gallolyticus TaxID=315405 RepID=A0A368UFS8_9STRE|nr:hypothetical protein CAC02_01015 [Streptococcus gallolyticus]
MLGIAILVLLGDGIVATNALKNTKAFWAEELLIQSLIRWQEGSAHLICLPYHQRLSKQAFGLLF